MKFKTLSILAGIASATVLSATSAQAASALDTIMANKVVRIAVPTDYPPYGFVGTDLKPRGLDIDISNLLAQKLGVKVELVPVTSANRIPYLQTKKVDLVVSTLGKNAEREKVIDFSSIAYAPFYQAVFGPKNATIKSYNDLVGKTVAVTRGAMEDEQLQKLAPAGVEIRRFEDNNATVAAYVAGQTQFIAVSAATAGSMAQKNPQVSSEYKLLLRDSACFVGLNQGEPALKEKVDAIIETAMKDGTLDGFSKKWLGRPVGHINPNQK